MQMSDEEWNGHNRDETTTISMPHIFGVREEVQVRRACAGWIIPDALNRGSTLKYNFVIKNDLFWNEQILWLDTNRGREWINHTIAGK